MRDEFTNEALIAWAAGLFEGEGCWNVYRPRGKTQVQARLAMTDPDAVRRFAAVMGFGTVRARASRRPHEKPLTEWYTQKRENVRTMIALFLPYLGERRRQRALEILALGEVRPHGERTHCPQGHPYVGGNLRVETNVRGTPIRRCVTCRRAQDRERMRRRRAAA